MGASPKPKWEQDAKKRLADFIKNQRQVLAKPKQDDANEATIRLVVTEMMCGGMSSVNPSSNPVYFDDTYVRMAALPVTGTLY